ncbi:BgTH12-03789 [Blumeria graminis f. sp. triticale]|uniref:BgTH12-03789 n=1 Tax=Blumeria graminis f. sp. triticale TaxID=1689686 RepID=A0A9W4CWA2_BLUGR|nr:BgTH12-03789 [Blumeria graminis f. sp. triticale]
MIGLKRKSSDLENYNPGAPFGSSTTKLAINSEFSTSYLAARPLLPSRTRKRLRYDRPSEPEIHKHTLFLLFSAQNCPKAQSTQPNGELDEKSTTPLLSECPSKQSNLHAFLRIPLTSGNSLTPKMSLPPRSSIDTYSEKMICHDCDIPLENDQELSSLHIYENDHTCTSCGKYVCHSCSISNLGLDRKCLNCIDKIKNKKDTNT